MIQYNTGAEQMCVLFPHLMVCSKIVNLFLVYSSPEVFADKFHCVQLIFEPGTIFSKPASQVHQKNFDQSF